MDMPRFMVVTMLLATPGGSCTQATLHAALPTLRVRVYDSSDELFELRVARRSVERIFKNAGISVSWLDCT